jgi:myo-inositol 2-dehydrogenase / D-chiro-inositol 1-dehydrogenase
MTVRVGVVGSGIMGADHSNTLHRHVSGAAVTMVADLDLARAREVAAALPDVLATDDGFALIGDPAVDAVVVASADATHAGQAEAPLPAG